MHLESGIFYNVYESGAYYNNPPVILIHGAAGIHLSWPPQIRRLTGFKTYALDLPGHGQSQGPGLDSIQGYAKLIGIWARQLNLAPAILIGHSMGGAIALTLASEYPEQVRGLVLVGVSSRLQVAPALLEAITDPTRFSEAIHTLIAWSFSRSADPRTIALVTRQMTLTQPEVLQRDFLACNAFDITDRLPAIQQPVLVICGSADRMTPLRHSEFLANQLPHACLEIISDTGHMTMLEAPQVVASALYGFLEKIKTPGGMQSE